MRAIEALDTVNEILTNRDGPYIGTDAFEAAYLKALVIDLAVESPDVSRTLRSILTSIRNDRENRK